MAYALKLSLQVGDEYSGQFRCTAPLNPSGAGLDLPELSYNASIDKDGYVKYNLVILKYLGATTPY